jgi:cation-transporting P-type ATPase C
VETADVALASDDLRHVADVMDISRKTMRVIRQNYAIAVGVNSAGLVFAAAGSINPILAAVLHNVSTLFVVFNSSRLIHYEPVAMPLLASAFLAGAPEKEESHRGISSTRKDAAQGDHREHTTDQLNRDQLSRDKGSERPVI